MMTRQEMYLVYATYALQRAQEHIETNTGMTGGELIVLFAGDVAEAQEMLMDYLRGDDQ